MTDTAERIRRASKKYQKAKLAAGHKAITDKLFRLHRLNCFEAESEIEAASDAESLACAIAWFVKSLLVLERSGYPADGNGNENTKPFSRCKAIAAEWSKSADDEQATAGGIYQCAVNWFSENGIKEKQIKKAAAVVLKECKLLPWNDPQEMALYLDWIQKFTAWCFSSPAAKSIQAEYVPESNHIFSGTGELFYHWHTVGKKTDAESAKKWQSLPEAERRRLCPSDYGKLETDQINKNGSISQKHLSDIAKGRRQTYERNLTKSSIGTK